MFTNVEISFSLFCIILLSTLYYDVVSNRINLHPHGKCIKHSNSVFSSNIVITNIYCHLCLTKCFKWANFIQEIANFITDTSGVYSHVYQHVYIDKYIPDHLYPSVLTDLVYEEAIVSLILLLFLTSETDKLVQTREVSGMLCYSAYEKAQGILIQLYDRQWHILLNIGHIRDKKWTNTCCWSNDVEICWNSLHFRLYH